MELMDVLDMAGRVAVFGVLAAGIGAVAWRLVCRTKLTSAARPAEASRTADFETVSYGYPDEVFYDRFVAIQYGIGDASKLTAPGSPMLDP